MALAGSLSALFTHAIKGPFGTQRAFLARLVKVVRLFAFNFSLLFFAFRVEDENLWANAFFSLKV